MQTWTMRILGALNILFVAFGAFYSVGMIQMHWNRWPSEASYFDWVVFVFLNVISIFLVSYLGYLGVKLIQKDITAVRKLFLLFMAEIIYFFAMYDLTWVVMPISMSKIAFGLWALAEDPLVPQYVTGYPLIGAIVTLVMLIIRRKSEMTHVE